MLRLAGQILDWTTLNTFGLVLSNLRTSSCSCAKEQYEVLVEMGRFERGVIVVLHVTCITLVVFGVLRNSVRIFIALLTNSIIFYLLGSERLPGEKIREGISRFYVSPTDNSYIASSLMY